MKEEFTNFCIYSGFEHMARTFLALTERNRYLTQLMSKQGVQIVTGTLLLLKSLSGFDQVSIHIP